MNKINNNECVNVVKRDIEMTELITELINTNLTLYDDACNQIKKGVDVEYYKEVAKEALTLIQDLLEQLPEKGEEIAVRVYSEKAQ